MCLNIYFIAAPCGGAADETDPLGVSGPRCYNQTQCFWLLRATYSHKISTPIRWHNVHFVVWAILFTLKKKEQHDILPHEHGVVNQTSSFLRWQWKPWQLKIEKVRSNWPVMWAKFPNYKTYPQRRIYVNMCDTSIHI